MTDIGDNAVQSMISFIARVERVNEEIASLQADRKNIYQEVKEAGWDVKALKRVIRERAMDRDDLDEFDALVAQYWGALGRGI